MTEEFRGIGLSGDEPIEINGQDRFGRRRLAERIEAEARSAPADGGFVIALCGEWGSGKTSVVNMAMERLRADDSIEVMAFNPWMVSGVARNQVEARRYKALLRERLGIRVVSVTQPMGDDPSDPSSFLAESIHETPQAPLLRALWRPHAGHARVARPMSPLSLRHSPSRR